MVIRAASIIALVVCCTLAKDIHRIKRDIGINDELDPVHIVGGQNAAPDAWPWQVLIKYRRGFICGGTLIAPDTVLTAAHCVYRTNHRKFSVVVGEYNRRKNERRTRGERTIRVARVIMHENYNDNTIENDIAILKLKSSATLGTYVQPIPDLAGQDTALDGSTCYVTGWGVYKGRSKSAKILQELQTNFISNTDCENRLNYGVSEDMVCTNNEPRGACFGDSGGPLQCMVGGRYVHVGIVSWGSSDCTVGPTVYAKTAYFRDWIANKM